MHCVSSLWVCFIIIIFKKNYTNKYLKGTMPTNGDVRSGREGRWGWDKQQARDVCLQLLVCFFFVIRKLLQVHHIKIHLNTSILHTIFLYTLDN